MLVEYSTQVLSKAGKPLHGFSLARRREIDAKIKSILTDEQYKKYQDMRKKDNAKKKKKAK